MLKTGNICVFFVLVAAVATYLTGCSGTDMTPFSTSEGLLHYQNNKGRWTSVDTVSNSDLIDHRKIMIDEHGIRFYQIPLKRQSVFLLNAFEFHPRLDFQTIFKEKFQLSVSRDIIQNNPRMIFCINANYFGENYMPLGWVVHEGKAYSRELTRFSGYFFVMDDGTPFVGPRSLRQTVKGKIQEAVQTYPSLIQNHVPFDYVLSDENRFFNKDEKTWRILAGMMDDGSIIFLASDAGCNVDLKELVRIAVGLDVTHAIALDGGGSVQYSFRYQGIKKEFSVRGRRVPVFIGISEPN